MEKNKHLLKEIEQTRIEMIEMAFYHGLTNERTLKISKRLDELLNCYHQNTHNYFVSKK